MWGCHIEDEWSSLAWSRVRNAHVHDIYTNKGSALVSAGRKNKKNLEEIKELWKSIFKDRSSEGKQNNCLLSGKHFSIEAIPIYKKFPLKCQFLLQRRHHLNYNCFFQKLCSCYMSSFPFSTFLRPAETSAEPQIILGICLRHHFLSVLVVSDVSQAESLLQKVFRGMSAVNFGSQDRIYQHQVGDPSGIWIKRKIKASMFKYFLLFIVYSIYIMVVFIVWLYCFLGQGDVEALKKWRSGQSGFKNDVLVNLRDYVPHLRGTKLRFSKTQDLYLMIQETLTTISLFLKSGEW